MEDLRSKLSALMSARTEIEIRNGGEILFAARLRPLTAGTVGRIEAEHPRNRNNTIRDFALYVAKILNVAIVDDQDKPRLSAEEWRDLVPAGVFWQTWDVASKALGLRVEEKAEGDDPNG